MALEKIARYKPGDNVSVTAHTAGGQITAARFVAVSGTDSRGAYKGAHAAAGDDAPFGVSQRSSADPATEAATSNDLLVECVRQGAIAIVEAGAAVAVGKVAVGTGGKAIAASDAVAADVDLGDVEANNAITVTAREAGTDGNDLSITFVDPGEAGQSLSVDVDGDDIVVSLATDGESNITSTATQVIAAIAEHDTASQLVTADNTGESSGAGVVTAEAKQSLAGGEDGTNDPAVGKALTAADEDGDFIEVDLY